MHICALCVYTCACCVSVTVNGSLYSIILELLASSSCVCLRVYVFVLVCARVCVCSHLCVCVCVEGNEV